MTLHFRGRSVAVECDDSRCAEEAESDRGETWDSFWPIKKAEGWVARKVGQDWAHYCPKHAKGA